MRRHPERADYDRAIVDAILDEGLVAHVAFVDERGPFVIPMLYARDGDRLLIHGSNLSRTVTATGTDIDLCVCVTLLDGIVLARSAFHHSMNYRSVMIFGRGRPILDEAGKRAALERFLEHAVPGRGAGVRPPSDAELKVTGVVEIDLEEASAKVRSGPPQDAQDDKSLPVWAGVLPVRLTFGPACADDLTGPDTLLPDYVARYRRA